MSVQSTVPHSWNQRQSAPQTLEFYSAFCKLEHQPALFKSLTTKAKNQNKITTSTITTMNRFVLVTISLVVSSLIVLVVSQSVEKTTTFPKVGLCSLNALPLLDCKTRLDWQHSGELQDCEITKLTNIYIRRYIDGISAPQVQPITCVGYNPQTELSINSGFVKLHSNSAEHSADYVFFYHPKAEQEEKVFVDLTTEAYEIQRRLPRFTVRQFEKSSTGSGFISYKKNNLLANPVFVDYLLYTDGNTNSPKNQTIYVKIAGSDAELPH